MPAIGVAILAGQCTIETRAQRLTLAGRQVCVLSNPGGLQINFHAATAMVFYIPELDRLPLLDRAPARMDALSTAVLESVCSAPAVSRDHHAAALAFVCHRAAAQADRPAAGKRSRASEAAAYMAAHMDEPLALKDLALHCACSASTLSADFRNEYGAAPMHYLADIRLRHARMALERTEEPVTAIAHAVGFTDVAAFSHFFKRHTGQSPSAARRAARWVL